MKKYITSESVSASHPDKACDCISDALLDAYLIEDNDVKTGIEVMLKDNICVIGGEVSTSSSKVINIEEIVKDVVRDLGYTKEKHLDPDSIKIINLLGKQSVEINKAVVKEDGEIGSGDQGIMFGYATSETPNFMPLDIYIAKVVLNDVLNDVLFLDKNGKTLIGPDAKSQVTIVEENGIKHIDSILISTMHSESLLLTKLIELVDFSINTSINKNNLEKYINNTKIFINPAGQWNIGGSVSDCGLTGRKIVVDQYGANCSVGGGAFSGKDFSKLDRSGSYAARHIAKNIVTSGLLAECKVELSYIIGIAEPSSIRITGKKNIFDDNEIVLDENQTALIKQIFPLTPKQICDRFNLKHFTYYQTAKYGHFGISSYPWEQLDKVEELKKLFNL